MTDWVRRAAAGLAAGALAGGACAADTAATFNESGGERQVLNFNDLGAATGLAPPGDYAGFAVNRAFLRGFENESALRNGYRDFGYLGQESDAALDAVEVYRGPSSALYGNGKPGGDINVLTLRPDGQRHRDGRLRVDRYGFRSLRFDVGDALPSADAAFRMGGVAEGGPERGEFDRFEGYGFAPAVVWQPMASTRVTLEADWLKVRDHVQADRIPLPALLAFPGRASLGEPTDRVDKDGTTWRLAIEQAITPAWRWRQAFFLQRGRVAADVSELDVYGLTGDEVLADGGRAVRRVAVSRRVSTEGEVSQTELYGQFDAGGAGHQFVAALELGRYRADTWSAAAPLAALDLGAPVHGAAPGVFVHDTDQSDGSRTASVLLQDRMTFGPHWQALLGVRVEQARVWSENRLAAADGRHEGRSTLVSPRLGIVYTPHPGLSWYTSWTHSSRPQLGRATAGGDLLPPEEGAQFEVGVQWGQARDGLLGTVALYELTRRGLATTDPSNPSFSVAGGERRSRGLELELRGEPAPGWTLDASAELLHARVVDDNDVPAGTRLPGVSPWFATFWVSRALNEQWTAGWGVVGEGRRTGGWTADAAPLRSYVTTDLTLAVRGDGWRLQASFNNVLGREAWMSDGYAVWQVAPRGLSLAWTQRF